jgi:hypothetical protein
VAKARAASATMPSSNFGSLKKPRSSTTTRAPAAVSAPMPVTISALVPGA